MDYRINSVGVLILIGFSITIFIPSRSAAQTESAFEEQKLSFVNFEYLEDETETSFDLQFETDSLLVEGRAATFVNGYDSLKLDSYEMLPNEDDLIKIEGYLFNKQSKEKLKWISAVSFTTSPKKMTLVSRSYIQFAAYYKLQNAEMGLAFFDDFNPDIVYVGGMYKLVLPFDKEDFNKARKKYKNYNIWRAEYSEVKVIQTAQPNLLISSVSKEEMNLSTGHK